MQDRLARLLVASVVAVALTLGSALAAAAYIEQSQIQVLLSGPSGTVRCDRSASISAKVVSTKTGKPVSNQLVRWSLSGAQSGSDGLSASGTVTNKQGKTGVSLAFGPVAGARTVTASASRVSPSVTVRCAGGLPRTAPVPPPGFVDQPSNALMAPPSIREPGFGQPTPATALRLDRLGMDVPLVEGDGVRCPMTRPLTTPARPGPGRAPTPISTVMPGRATFLELWGVRTGDVIEMDMADGRSLDYRVTEIRPVVAWDALEYLAPTPKERLTLQTCLSYDDTAPRFVVVAEPLSGM